MKTSLEPKNSPSPSESAPSTARALSPANTGPAKAGRPTKYTPANIAALCAALADGMPVKAACRCIGIGESTLSEWRERHPELTDQLESAREAARHRALAAIRSAGERGDWRALEAWLKLAFPADYRTSHPKPVPEPQKNHPAANDPTAAFAPSTPPLQPNANPSPENHPLTLTPETLSSLQARRTRALSAHLTQ